MLDPQVTHRWPLVSVLTPSFGQARWLEDNLRSVHAQTYASIEHVVMDGGSTDGSVGILESRSRDGLLWASEPDKGQSDAINRAFARSSGEIIGWLNSDDAYFSRDAVARAVAIFEANPEVGVVYGHAALVNAEGTVLQVIWTPSLAPAVLRAYNLLCQPTVFVRRSMLGRALFVDPAFDYMMDWELWLHLARRTRFKRLDLIVAIDRHHLQRKSYTRLDLAAHDHALIRKRYRTAAWASNPILAKGVKVTARLAGLSKVAEAARGGDALALNSSSPRAIAVRQVAQLRRWMPSGDN
ncbi:MAG: glycosyltransferase [Chloroflexota bacterium]|nr:glycosyltransferase [Chloroflexota bacterium]